MADLSAIRHLIIDMDGVLYRGNEPTPGLGAFFDMLRERCIKFRLATNNSSNSPASYTKKLKKMGVDVGPDNIITSGIATSMYLKDIAADGTRIYVIGGTGLFKVLLDEGRYVLDPDSPEIVVAGYDPQLTYEKLKIACLAIRRGARFVATNLDPTLPTEEGEIPGAGAIIAALRVSSEVTPVSIGKPEPFMMELAMRQMGANRDDTAVLGDRLTTDVVGGQRAGVTTILVLTGVATREEIESSQTRPDYVFQNLIDLVEGFRSQGQMVNAPYGTQNPGS